jgi:hypothetical protein
LDFLVPVGFRVGTVGTLRFCRAGIGSDEVVVIDIFVVFKVAALGLEVFDVRSTIVDANTRVTANMSFYCAIAPLLI